MIAQGVPLSAVMTRHRCRRLVYRRQPESVYPRDGFLRRRPGFEQCHGARMTQPRAILVEFIVQRLGIAQVAA